MAETESDIQQAQLRTKLPKEVQSSFYVIVFIGLALSVAGCISLFFLTPIFNAESAYIVPGFAIFSITMAICALIARQCAGFLATKGGSAISLAACFLCGTLGPLGLLFGEPMWWWALCVSAVGCLCIIYEWWSHLCSLEHRILVFFVSSALLAGSAIVLVLALLGLNGIAGAIVASALLLVSSIFLCFLEDGRRAMLYFVDADESLNRVRSLTMRRLGEFSYFAIGLMVAVVVELMAFIVPADFGSIPGAAVIMFMIAMVFIFAICAFGHWRKSFDLEGRSKDYLTFTCAIGFLPLPFVSGVPLFVLLVYLLFIVGLQLTLVITAVIELARFEEISPLWYLGETTFLFVGMCIGSVMAKVCFLQMPGTGAIIAICMSAVIFISFAQVFFNKFSYPEIELFRSESEDSLKHLSQKHFAGSGRYESAEDGAAVLGIAGADTGGTNGQDAGAQAAQPGDGALSGASNKGAAGALDAEGSAASAAVDEVDQLKGSMRFRKRIAEISEVYGLSPRQREILELLAKGRNASYIMEHFHISRSTVKTHVYNIYIKLEIHSRQELLDLIESDEDLTKPGYL